MVAMIMAKEVDGMSVAGQGFFGAAPSGPLASAPVAFPVLPGAGAVLPAASVAAGIPPFPVAGGDVAPGGPAVTIPAAGLQAGGHVAGGLVDGKGAVVGPTGGTKAAAKLGSGGVMASGGMQAVGASRVGVRQLILLGICPFDANRGKTKVDNKVMWLCCGWFGFLSYSSFSWTEN
ncbi:Os04g0122100 [Oryza sativa Japonica Group]|uniref:Os04g0122100 protein n=1 Tax=Oryza sativa subsp. japonica TaxID=39947 RepID=A0A0P0W6F6_ORYSJ|nr:Os04g0122100 [Oryza sativa Japonica Group]